MLNMVSFNTHANHYNWSWLPKWLSTLTAHSSRHNKFKLIASQWTDFHATASVSILYSRIEYQWKSPTYRQEQRGVSICEKASAKRSNFERALVRIMLSVWYSALKGLAWRSLISSLIESISSSYQIKQKEPMSFLHCYYHPFCLA